MVGKSPEKSTSMIEKTTIDEALANLQDATSVANVIGISGSSGKSIPVESFMAKSMYPKGLISSGDADDYKSTGLYNLGSGIAHIPSDCAWSDLIVFGGYATLQITYSKTNGNLYARIFKKGAITEEWTAWMKVTVTSV